MAQNKLKLKVEALTRVVKHLLEEVKETASLAQGTLTALQIHLGKDKWNKLLKELKKLEENNTKDKKLDLDVE